MQILRSLPTSALGSLWAPGDLSIRDFDVTVKITPADRTLLATRLPESTYGFFYTNLKYKKLFFRNLDFQGVYGNEI